MKISCSQSELLKGLTIVSSAVAQRTTNPIMECILIDASTNDIRLTGNNNQMGIETIIPGSIRERGQVAIESKKLLEIVRNLPNNQVIIESNNNFETAINCDTAHFTVPGRNGDEFPYIPVLPRNVPIEISQYSLREIIRQTIFSTVENDNGHLMNGELLQVEDNRLRLCSLDGHRISIRNLKLRDSHESLSAIIPARTLGEISKNMSGSVDDMVSIYITGNHVIFEFDMTTVVSRLIEGTFFNVNNMLSDDFETRIIINRRELVESIRRALPMVSDTDKKPIVMTVHDQNMNISIVSSSGRFEEDLGMVKDGRDIQIAFNPKLILDVLKVVDEETVTMYLLTAHSPLFIKNEDGDYIYLVLPVNFNGR